MKGTTLLEFIIALSLLALCGALVFSLKPPSRKLQDEAETLVERLEWVSLWALLKHQKAEVLLEPGSYSIGAKTFHLRPPVILSEKSQTIVSFYPSGVISPKTLILHEGKKRCSIKISLRGRITKLCHLV